jgi:hypothetical protein
LKTVDRCHDEAVIVASPGLARMIGLQALLEAVQFLLLLGPEQVAKPDDVLPEDGGLAASDADRAKHSGRAFHCLQGSTDLRSRLIVMGEMQDAAARCLPLA